MTDLAKKAGNLSWKEQKSAKSYQCWPRLALGGMSRQGDRLYRGGKINWALWYGDLVGGVPLVLSRRFRGTLLPG